MSVIPTWAWWVGGGFAYLLTWRYAFREAVERAPVSDFGDLITAILFMFVVAAPAAVAFLLMRGADGHDAAAVARHLGGETASQKRKRREAEIREREEQIHQAERELGIS